MHKEESHPRIEHEKYTNGLLRMLWRPGVRAEEVGKMPASKQPRKELEVEADVHDGCHRKIYSYLITYSSFVSV